jgi:uncharacterized protein (DUF1778 family)
MSYKKLSADFNEEEFNLVKEASEKEQRSIANFVRLACQERAKEIISESKKLEVQNGAS